MKLVDLGHGPPVIVLPGIQGRWEWHRPGIDALAARCRVVTFSYADEHSAGLQPRPDAGIEAYCDEIVTAMNQAAVPRAVICGISYGGLVAAVFAARHPERVSGLVLVSALPPTWTPDGRIAAYLRWPTLLTPVFLAASLRLYPEIRRASPHALAAVRTAAAHAGRALTHMFSPRRMARRAATIAGADLVAEIATIAAPARIIVGDDGVDRVVPVAKTLEYTTWLPQARVVTLERTGHLGCVTRPEAFATLVSDFVTGEAAGSPGDEAGPRQRDRRRLG